MTTKKLTKLLALYLPYILLGLVATNFGEAWRLAEGKELGDKIMSMMGTVPVAFANPLPSLHPIDLLVGLCCGAGLRLAVYLRGKNAKKYRHGMEYGSARWGTPKDIEPFMAPKFADNIILTKTERLMMSNRPPDPKNARNKNVLVVGGSGSGKTRFWLKPNLLQCHSSYVITDPKGSIVVECGNALLKNGYKLKILNTINFSKSMHYNPFAYVHSEKDILKLVTTLMTNTKGEGSGGDPFWEKSERLLLTALIAYLHLPHNDRQVFQPGKFSRILTAVPGDDLIATFRARAGNQRSQHTVLCNALHRPGHGFIVQHLEWVVGEGVQFVDGNLLYLFPLLLLSFFLGGKQVI